MKFQINKLLDKRDRMTGGFSKKKNTLWRSNKIFTSVLSLVLMVVSTFHISAQEVVPQFKPGELDTNFGVGGKVTGTFMAATELAIQKDNKIVVGGFGSVDLARFLPDGALDTTFSNDGKVEGLISTIQDIAIQSDGKILIAGFQGGGSSTDFGLARYNADGTPDNTFGNGGVATVDFFGLNDQVTAIAIQTDGRIVVGGRATISQTATDFGLVRFTATGTLDPTFGVGGKINTQIYSAPGESENFEEVHDLAIQPDGRIVAVGVSDIRLSYARYLTNGSLDGSFAIGGKAILPLNSSSAAHSIALLSDGGILIGGGIGQNGFDFLLMRVLANGTPDLAFGNGGKVITDFGIVGGTDFGYSLAVLADGRILQAGMANMANVNDSVYRDFALVCYKADGSLDTTFGNGGKITTDFFSNEDEARAIALQSNGRAIVAGRVKSAQSGFGLAAYALGENTSQNEPQIQSVQVKGKKLLVTGVNFESPTEIYVNGERQKKTANDIDNPTTLVIAAKSGRWIAPGQTVMIQVKNTASGKVSSEIMYTRPLE
ncbi:MAG: hypothetical protein AB1757_07630 [Acidobacteriota bacterium]